MRAKTWGIVALAPLCLAACKSERGAVQAESVIAQPEELRLEEIRKIARDAYIYGFPLVAQYAGIHAAVADPAGAQYKGPPNQVLQVSRGFRSEDSGFAAPNAHTLYSLLLLDLRAEPLVLTVPQMGERRYFVFQLMDGLTFNFADIGTRATGNEGGSFLVVGPGWQGESPAGVSRVFRSETHVVIGVGRTRLLGPDDFENVKTIQSEYRLQTLSSFQGRPAPPSVPALTWVQPILPDPARFDLDFFTVVAHVLQYADPPHPDEVEMRKNFERLGIVPGQPFDSASLSPERRRAVFDGMADGQRLIDAKLESVAGNTEFSFGTREFLRNDYVARATGAQTRIGANAHGERIYLFIDEDEAGEALDEGRNKPGGALP